MSRSNLEISHPSLCLQNHTQVKSTFYLQFVPKMHLFYKFTRQYFFLGRIKMNLKCIFSVVFDKYQPYQKLIGLIFPIPSLTNFVHLLFSVGKMHKIDVKSKVLLQNMLSANCRETLSASSLVPRRVKIPKLPPSKNF